VPLKLRESAGAALRWLLAVLRDVAVADEDGRHL